MRDSLYVFVMPQRLKRIKKSVSLYGLIVEKQFEEFLDDSKKSEKLPTICQLCRRRRRLKRYPLQVRHEQDWGRGFILLLPQTAALPGLDAGSDVIKPASNFVIQNRQTSCSMWCPIYRARC